VFIIIEEAHTVLLKGKEKRYDLGEPPVTAFLRSARKIDGESCVIITDQVPSKVDPVAVSNCGNIIIFKLVRTQDVLEAGNSAGLKPYQRDKIQELGRREIIARLARYDRPLKLKVEELNFPQAPSKEEARRRSRDVLGTIPYTKPAEEKPPEEKKKEDTTLEPDSNEFRTFATVARDCTLTGPDRRDHTGLSPDADSRAIKRLQALGLIVAVGQLSKLRFYSLTTRGAEVAKRMGLAVAGLGKGSVCHEAGLEYTERSLRQFCGELEFHRKGAAVTVNGSTIEADSMIVHTSTGKRWALQFSWKNSARYESEQLLALNQSTELAPDQPDKIQKVICVAGSKGHFKGIEKALKRRNGGSIPGNIKMLVFDEIIKNETDWKDIINV